MQSFNPAVSHKRKERDITKLMMSNYKVFINNENPCNFKIEIEGPADSLYTGGTWTLNVHLPDQYPYKSPSIGFINKIFHPNVDEASGSVCLDVINQSWSPMYDLINVFDVFIPQLLQYPNPSDPLNPEAASLLMKEKTKQFRKFYIIWYEKKVREMVQKYAVKNVDLEKSAKTIENIEVLKHLATMSTQMSGSQQTAEIVEEEDVSQISLSDVSELSQHPFENNDIMSQF